MNSNILEEIIEKIFFESNYINSNMELIEGVSLYCNTDKKIEDYFLILYLEDKLSMNLIKETIYELFSKIKKLTSEFKGIEKNTSLIILFKKNDLNKDEELENMIYFLEEDPYHFKKQVFVYSAKQLEIVNNNFKSSNQSLILDYFTKVLYEEQRFSKFKNISRYDEGLDLEYEFISKIFIKIPFMNLHVKKDTLGNLSNSINEKLQNIDESLLLLKNNLLELVGDDKKELEIIDILKVLEMEQDEF